MRNGKYEMVVAPDDYPGRRFRGRYCYEHTLVYWQHTGEVPGPDECIHHKNDKKRDNRFSNLELKKKTEHNREHQLEKGRAVAEFRCPCCHSLFEREVRLSHIGKGRKGSATFCSRSCAGKGPVGDVENVVRTFRKMLAWC